jgi:hydrogenase nickel incorporation protein HypA/HybF
VHEAAIAQSIIETVLKEAEKQKALKVESVEIEIGELTFLGTEQVEFWVNTGFSGTIAENARLVFKILESRLICGSCGYEGKLPIKDTPACHAGLPSFACPECSSSKIELSQGRETVIRNIRIIKK